MNDKKNDVKDDNDKSYPRATVRLIDGQLVLDDKDAVAIIRAIGKRNCRSTFDLNLDRVQYFKQIIAERGMTADDMVIMLLNVDDVNGGLLADRIMPNVNWQAMRDRGEIPFAGGLIKREGIQLILHDIDKEAAEKLQAMTEIAVVVVDHGVVEIFTV